MERPPVRSPAPQHRLGLPKRWIVERTLAWIGRNRRLSRDYERQTRIAAIFVKLAMIRIMLAWQVRECLSLIFRSISPV